MMSAEVVTQPAAPSLVLVVGAGLTALLIVGLGWAVTRYAITIAHEGGHALTASSLGVRVAGIVIDSRGGETKSDLVPGSANDFLITLAGYVAPSLFGLGGAILLNVGQVRNVLWLSLGFLVCALFMSRNPVTVVKVGLTLLCILAVLRYAGAGFQTFFAYAWIWFLLIGGVRSVLNLSRIRETGRDTVSDVYFLQKSSYLPASLWIGFYGLFSFASLVLGALILSDSL